eukprot:NODE_17_length_48642_cov_1.199349.p39 type:complete len:137 gc:universal NODE_17_length_48642_cov_1.199349:18111-17701(-)
MLDSRKKRNKLPDEVIRQLEKVFQSTNGTPESDLISQLSEKYDVHRDKIRIWFNNRRAKYRRLALEKELSKVKCVDIPDHILQPTIQLENGEIINIHSPPSEPSVEMLEAVRHRILELQEFIKTILPEDDDSLGED